MARTNVLDLSNLKHFVLDECDQMLEQPGTSIPRLRSLPLR
jgi:superfamily II DNA/RNA helicase